MDKKQVLTRVSQETYDRLQALSDKYGMSASSLVAALINDRWLSENSTVNRADLVYPERAQTENKIPVTNMVPKSRKRHKSKQK